MVDGPKQPIPDNSEQYLAMVASQLGAIMASPEQDFVKPPPHSTLRGIDVYSAPVLVHAMARAVDLYVHTHRRLPNLVYPASLTEKMLWSKFFTPIPMPSAGDKLAISRYLPPGYEDRIAIPTRVWTSPKPALPANDEILPGAYFLKANHGSGFNLALTYPLSEPDRAAAQATAASWLASDYGMAWGEWWYSRFQRRLLLEAHLGEPGADVPDWKFWVINGRMYLAQVNLDRAANHRLAFYDRDYGYLRMKNRWYPQAEKIAKPATYDAMVEAAEAIGQRFSFARVDFYLPPSGQITLGEITLCPDNAATPFSSVDFDFRLGRRWDPRIIGPKPKTA